MAKGNGKAKLPDKLPENLPVPQEHGGAIYQGGVVGHKGAGGRPPNELRGSLRDILERGLPVLQGYIDGRVPVTMVGKCEECGHEHEDYELLPADVKTLGVKDADRLKALDLAGKYGGVADLALVIDEQPEQELTKERIEEAWQKLQRIKSIEALERLLVGSVK